MLWLNRFSIARYRSSGGDYHRGTGRSAGMICVMTRFELRYFWDLLPVYMMYRGMRRGLAHTPGLIRHAFLVQSPSACMTLSIWASGTDIVRFPHQVPEHVPAVRWVKRRCRHIWSGYWRLDMVSKTADQWPGAIPWPSGIVRDAPLDVLATMRHEMERDR
jgi:hypothetical protein